MARKLLDIAHVNVRLRERLRRKLEAAAKAHRCSLNKEIGTRLEDSFERREAGENLFDLISDMRIVWARYGEMFHAIAMQSDLVRATEALVAQVERSAGLGKAVEDAVAEVKRVTATIDAEAAAAMRRLHAV